MTEWFQGTLGYGLGWFTATLILILMIALPLMLAVAMIILADRKIWAAMALRRGPNVVGRSACCRASRTASKSS
jgi:NADH-quinone oxidoreductase subunit H